ncbi:DnaB-like helicase C-terminal domain-containing protein [Paenibacillus hamazuiensis]|uniref:DnaB-like helicase C-terminal domain-containing protein n=1 Tax=Paenibacillus hamazuiensis TaxID=2936508 RepID=UPI00200BE38A|nr:DnaB-like helicase C-terminal domain-containing protein [Paenibacillus hamazuiensis]
MSNNERVSVHTGKTSFDLEQMVAHYQKQLREEAFFYLQKRGISEEIIEQYRIGFDPGKIGFVVDSGQLGNYFENRVIIPITDENGTTVDLIGRTIDHREPKYKSLFSLEDHLFNELILAETEDVVLCNGVFDVLSLAQVRLPAVSVPDLSTFKEQHAEKLREKRVFICMGNDELGRRESVRIQTILQKYASESYIVHLPETIRDINDFFVRVQNPLDMFMQILNHTIEETLRVPVSPDVRNITVYTEEYMKRYRGQVSGAATGISKLDEALFGGLTGGLYLLAGASSTGKSMLMKQMADHIAGTGTPVVYVSWDMTSFELWARSIARILGIAPQMVLSGKAHPEQIAEANKTYSQIGGMLWTLECSLDTTLDKVISSIGTIAANVGKTPVIFVDHLQRIPALKQQIPHSRNEDQSTIAYALKQWSRERQLPIVAALPTEPGQTRLPEGVEASADVIMFLKYGGSADGGAKPVILEVVKHRNGNLVSIPLQFFDSKALFTE